MRIATLRFPAFGPFTDHEIELNPNVGFHLFYGPNEAGKSSMLRGIRSLFFGIENRTSDDFLHNKPDLRIGARLLHSFTCFFNEVLARGLLGSRAASI